MTKQKEYEKQILDWRAAKHRGRVGENGWAALAGLFWLNEGNNLIGSNPVCEVVLPERAPTFLGIIEMKGKTARFQMAQGVRGQINGRMTQKAILKSSKDAKPTFITWNDIRMVLHEHAGRYAVRIWDNQRSERNRLPPPQWFPINKRFRFKAKYTRYKNPQPVSHTDAFGDIVKGKMDGFLTFRFENKSYQLDVSEQEDHELFVQFHDLTSGKETYGSGRYLYTEPVKSGKVILDFNYSYTPPCAFTEYATCVFAPPQNELPFRVEAGEIYRG